MVVAVSCGVGVGSVVLATIMVWWSGCWWCGVGEYEKAGDNLKHFLLLVCVGGRGGRGGCSGVGGGVGGGGRGGRSGGVVMVMVWWSGCSWHDCGEYEKAGEYLKHFLLLVCGGRACCGAVDVVGGGVVLVQHLMLIMILLL